MPIETVLVRQYIMYIPVSLLSKAAGNFVEKAIKEGINRKTPILENMTLATVLKRKNREETESMMIVPPPVK